MAGRTIVLPTYLDAVRKGTRQRLDQMSDVVPPLRAPEMPLPDYLSQAAEIAQQDPAFAARLGTALQQYQKLGG
jgi:hypothetical protein